jgi:hypothetical protein
LASWSRWRWAGSWCSLPRLKLEEEKIYFFLVYFLRSWLERENLKFFFNIKKNFLIQVWDAKKN